MRAAVWTQGPRHRDGRGDAPAAHALRDPPEEHGGLQPLHLRAGDAANLLQGVVLRVPRQQDSQRGRQNVPQGLWHHRGHEQDTLRVGGGARPHLQLRDEERHRRDGRGPDDLQSSQPRQEERQGDHDAPGRHGRHRGLRADLGAAKSLHGDAVQQAAGVRGALRLHHRRGQHEDAHEVPARGGQRRRAERLGLGHLRQALLCPGDDDTPERPSVPERAHDRDLRGRVRRHHRPPHLGGRARGDRRRDLRPGGGQGRAAADAGPLEDHEARPGQLLHERHCVHR
mmetsp:Transcript_50869/g.134413  ORF Transcript_50869/g.134413 Transcript_50869/m.134413 type:complete len:284 (+) Transcript_50869:642-1493(+)